MSTTDCITFTTPRMGDPAVGLVGPTFTGDDLHAGTYTVNWSARDDYTPFPNANRTTANQHNEQLGIGGQYTDDLPEDHPIGVASGAFTAPYLHPGGPVIVTHIGRFDESPGSVQVTFTLCADIPPTTTTAVPATTTAVAGASATTASTLPPALVPSSTIAPSVIDLNVTACDDGQESCLGIAVPPVPPTLPATGWGDSALGLGGSVLLLAGITLALIARRRNVRPTVNEPASNITGVRPVPFDWEAEK